MMKKNYDVIVIGAGHAGIEAALAAARLKATVLVFVTELKAVGFMACNPAVGGTAKGHIVREIDALGGEMGVSADAALLQIKMLNRGKGPAVHCLRGQEDKYLYSRIMLEKLRNTENLTLAEGEVSRIITEGGRVSRVVTAAGDIVRARAIVVATGVYLNSRIIIGDESRNEGPSGFKRSASGLTESLRGLGLEIRRFKTGTPARIAKDSIDFSKMQIQEGECDIHCFSHLTDEKLTVQQPCYLTYTNADTHRIIKENISRSPLYNGEIKGIGPRYCPSIEDKVMRFDKERHQIFIEPEGRDTDEMYVQGMSSSLPRDVQERMYATVAGLENVRILRYAYAIEYDCIDARALYHTYQVKHTEGLYTAGQINGSSGYEEAAAQGLIAGINAALYVKNEPPFTLSRSEAYIGVLTDDLVTKGTNEPYRMMTARAEHRILLREDTADLRLTPRAYAVGLASESRFARMQARKAEIENTLARALKEKPPHAAVTDLLCRLGGEAPKKGMTYAELIKRPEVSVEDVRALHGFDDISEQAFFTAVTEIKYEGYLKKEEADVKERARLEERLLPTDIDYSTVSGLRTEARQKLAALRPQNIGQASRISGVSPADITVLLVYLRTRKS
ncbi:MAG: tRNA uridine-5-carboxymethylaminomethyl(34) synthesis enzyme MnmG [Clostridiaceae bacterium]|jgi:tRNA uridine 5-carboxymethylaminomethyl modification enzyme|nr:tRNA uridine-5-carboxymethylaminomethyl(34) synthesis enzyme MnmG [Clostridiaceae bacterium]